MSTSDSARLMKKDVGSEYFDTVKRSLDWRRWFSGEQINKNSDNMDEYIKHTEKDVAVGICQLFRFADRLDVILMVIALSFMSILVVCPLVNLILFGHITGTLAHHSSAADCQYQYQTSTITTDHNITCPFGIELNSFNYGRFQKLCHDSDMISMPSLSTPVGSSFREDILSMVHWLFLVGIVALFSGSMTHFIWTFATKRQRARLNVLLFQSLIQRNMAYLDTNSISHLNSKLFTNIETIEAGTGFEFTILLALLSCIVISFILSLVYSWQLTLILLCIQPLVIGASLIFSKLTTKESKNELTTYSQAGEIVQEVFSSLRTVLSLNGSKFEQKRYERELDSTCRGSVRKGITYGIYVGWLSCIIYITYGLGFIFGSILMSYENLSESNITNILIVISLFAVSMQQSNMIGPFFQAFVDARSAAAPVFRLIDEAQETRMNEMNVLKEDMSYRGSPHDVNGDIEFDSVNFSYPSRKDVSVLHNLKFIARANQTTALVGASGCGKSTSISLLLRYYELSSGRITINGRSIAESNLKQLRQNIGVVSQEPILFGMSIYENIRFGKLNATRTEIEAAARQSNAHNFIMKLPNKYETLVGEGGVQLSGGEKQRVVLARALVKQPRILLLDEATSALDNVSERIVQEALDRACKNRTTIVIAHRLSTIRNADYIYVLDRGTIIEEGTHEILMADERSRYHTMVESQQMERLDEDGKDGEIILPEVTEEANKEMLKQSSVLNDGITLDKNETNSISFDEKFIFLRLLSMNSPEWLILFIGCLACLFSGLSGPVFAMLFAKIIQAFKDCEHLHRYHQVWSGSAFFVLLGFIMLFVHICQYTSFAITGSKLTQRIRSKAFTCLLRQEVAYFDHPENSSGAICARLSSDASAIQEMAGIRLGVICEGLALACFALLFGIVFSWQLAMIVLAAFLFQGVLTLVDIKLKIQLKQQSNVILQQANTLAAEVLQNMRTIKQLSIESEVLRQYSQLIEQARRILWKQNIVSSVAYGTHWGIQSFTLAFVYWCCVVLVESNQLTMHNVIIASAFAIFTMQSLQVVAMLTQRIGSSMAAAQSFFDLFDRSPTIDNLSNEGIELIDFRGEIELDRVDFEYPARPKATVLSKLDLSIKSGQHVALVGTSGCGKSTIVQLLERFYDVTHGRLLLDGVDIRQLNIHWLRSRLGLVSQEPILFNLTIAENIAYGLENISMEEIISAATKANIHKFIEQLPQGYETKVGVKGSFLSGGEKQRIAIARMLLRRPRLLLLDEATSAMDSHNEQIVQQALDDAQRDDASQTSLIIAHRLSTIRSCDMIYVLERGHIVERGTHIELIQQLEGIYRRMFTAQNNLQ